MMYVKKYLLIALMGLVAAGCSKKERFFPEATEKANVQIVRFDSVILNLPTDSADLYNNLKRIQEENAYSLMVFADYVIGLDYEDTESLTEELQRFLTDTVYGFKEINQQVRNEFADITSLREDINNAMGRLHYLYPDWDTPTLYFMVTGLQGNAYLLESNDFMIGVDMYLGSDFPYYNGVVYEYQKKQMNKDCITNHVILNKLYYHLDNPSKQNRLLDRILYEGRVMYMMQQLMPQKSAAYIIGYTDDEWKWCERNEKQIWGLICDKQDLFSSQPMLINSYVGDGPFTSEISQDSPSKIGIWIGWRIINSYMKNHPEISLQDMMKLEDSQIILQESGYRP